MWITKDTELPEDLLEAQESRKLVIFAGAGVSIDQPAGMPSFPALIRQLAEEHGEDLPEWAQSQPDLYMGELVEAGFPVHERVADILSPAEGATFNDYHSGLTRLFRDPADVRVVTTNHDPFFTLAAETLFPNRVESFYAPALPPGDEVAGIAYLHGGIARPPDRLVLTDADFGRAYLTKGWAANFLRALYARFAVLFVGYSHGEPVLKYLARGLAPTTKRFAFDRDDRDLSGWGRLGVAVVGYPKQPAPEPYGALRLAIDAWSERTQMGFIEHEARIRSLAQGGPPLDRSDSDYLKRALSTTVTARVFAGVASDPAWLTWAREVPQFVELFARGDASPAAWELARWFAEAFVIKHSDLALSVIQEHGGVLSVALWMACARQLWLADPRPDPDTFGVWISLLLEGSAPPDATRFLAYILSKCRWPEDRSAAVLLFAFLTDPHSILEPRLVALAGGGGPSVTTSVETRGDEHELRLAWEAYFAPDVDELAAELEPILAAQLTRAHDMMKATG